MPAFRAERVELLVDMSNRDMRCVVGAQGWTVAGDVALLAVAPDFATVAFDSGARLAVRKVNLKKLASPMSRGVA